MRLLKKFGGKKNVITFCAIRIMHFAGSIYLISHKTLKLNY